MFTKKDLMKLLAPLIVEQILIVLVGMVNVMMAAAVGEASVSGVSLVESINILVIQMLSALATGGAVISSQYLGKKQSENACKAAGQLIGVTTVLSVLVTLIALAGRGGLLRAIFGSVDESVMSAAVVYFWITPSYGSDLPGMAHPVLPGGRCSSDAFHDSKSRQCCEDQPSGGS